MMTRRIALSVILILGAGLVTGPPGAPTGHILFSDSPTAVAGEYIVQLDSSLPAGVSVRAEALRLTSRYGGRVGSVYEKSLRAFSMHAPSVVAARIAAASTVSSVEQSRLVSGAETPWGLDRIDQRALPLDDSYTPNGTGAGVTAYVVDSGVNIAMRTSRAGPDTAATSSTPISPGAYRRPRTAAATAPTSPA